MRAALRAGAAVEFVDGKLIVQPLAPSVEVPEQRKPEQRKPERKSSARKQASANQSYETFKDLLAPYTSSHVARVSSAMGLLYGIRKGDWTPGRIKLAEFMKDIDVPTMVQCAIRSAPNKVGVKVRGKLLSMSDGAITAAMYTALDQDPSLTLALLEAPLTGSAMHRKIREMASLVDELGGARSIEFRKQSYNQFLSILLSKEV